MTTELNMTRMNAFRFITHIYMNGYGIRPKPYGILNPSDKGFRVWERREIRAG